MKLLLALCAPLALAGCGFGSVASVPPAPVAVADQTVLDEQAALAVELAYKAARLAAELGVDAGVIRGANAARVAALDNAAYQAVLAARAAYRTGNADTYKSALVQARTSVAALLALTGN
jgi:hypothetical protein